MAAINQDDNTGFSNPPKQAGTTPSTELDLKLEDLVDTKVKSNKTKSGYEVTYDPNFLTEFIRELVTQERNKAYDHALERISWLSKQYARYGDGEVVYHLNEAVVPVSLVLKEYSELKKEANQ